MGAWDATWDGRAVRLWLTHAPAPDPGRVWIAGAPRAPARNTGLAVGGSGRGLRVAVVFGSVAGPVPPLKASAWLDLAVGCHRAAGALHDGTRAFAVAIAGMAAPSGPPQGLAAVLAAIAGEAGASALALVGPWSVAPWEEREAWRHAWWPELERAARSSGTYCRWTERGWPAPSAPPEATAELYDNLRGHAPMVTFAQAGGEAYPSLSEWYSFLELVAPVAGRAARVTVHLPSVRVPLATVVATLSKALPAAVRLEVFVDADGLFALPGPRAPPEQLAPVVPRGAPFSLRTCEGACAPCGWHDALFVAAGLARPRAETASLCDLLRFAEALRDHPGWWPHQAEVVRPLEEDSVAVDAAELQPALATATEFLVRRSALAPPPAEAEVAERLGLGM